MNWVGGENYTQSEQQCNLHDRRKGVIKKLHVSFVCYQQVEVTTILTLAYQGPLSIMADSNDCYFLAGQNITKLTAVKVRALRDVAIGSKNQPDILDNALATQRREGGREF